MTRRWCIKIDGPEARDEARAAVGVLPRGTVIVFIVPGAGLSEDRAAIALTDAIEAEPRFPNDISIQNL